MSVRFGDFELDQERRQLLRSGEPVPLEPKAYELLKLLLERRPRALSKAQIRDVVWPGVFVTDTALGVAVNAIRQALGDDARQPRFIRTVHGFGYAFCGEACEHEDTATGAARDAASQASAPAGAARDAVPQASAPAGAAVRRWRLRWTPWVVGGVVLVAAAAAALWYRHRGERPAPRLVQLTLVRHVATGSFSPDGSQVAFAAAGERGGDTDIWNTDIWLKIVGEAEARRLTTGPAQDRYPAWSTDGRDRKSVV